MAFISCKQDVNEYYNKNYIEGTYMYSNTGFKFTKDGKLYTVFGSTVGDSYSTYTKNGNIITTNSLVEFVYHGTYITCSLGGTTVKYTKVD